MLDLPLLNLPDISETSLRRSCKRRKKILRAAVPIKGQVTIRAAHYRFLQLVLFN